ncbi:hypothetical protein C8D88_1076 [Lentzea atacamensis]|uniref:Lipoprotein n=1 Tax=Lentzea atacamensis TaxID=531938 RepID=A0A316HXC5_9PSEU|nr:hypothetical protein [Lentzea atacamensis]PWK84799.1 hypothetical protein C8D88_1076 [Lentzea atacamensis]
MRLRSGVLGSLLAAVGVLTGCSVTGQYYEGVDSFGKQTVADWKQMPEVVDATYEYRHGLDQGQVLYLDVTIGGEVDKDTVIGQLQEVARRNFWQKTSSNDVKVNLAVHSEGSGLGGGSAMPGPVIYQGGLGQGSGSPEEKYGPRATTR